MYKQDLERDLKRVIRELGFSVPELILYVPENPNFGEYSSNIPLQLAKQNSANSKQSSLDIASDILQKFGHPQYLERIDIAGPGFLNFFLKDESLLKSLGSEIKRKTNKDAKRYLIEFANLNTHKSFHIGHLRNITIGESISRTLEYLGNEVYRVNYGGDIGPHVAKAIWAIRQLADEYEKAKNGSLQDKGEFLGKAYAHGSEAYDESPEAKKEIDELNVKLYGKDSELAPLWEETKKWSIAYFESIYSRLGTKFDAQIWDSEIQERGKQIAEENLERVFIKDDGAIIFPGEKYGLHNRVFVTSKGYPTYEAKELGLTEKERELFPYDFSVHVVDVQQSSFFEVTNKALEMIDQKLLGRKKHLSYGFVNLSTGKMSSREGNIIIADELIKQVKEKILQNITTTLDESSLEKIALAAVKFTFLKYSLISEIAFNIEQSVSLSGDSGPYIQYTYARISSLVNRAKKIKASNKMIQIQKHKIAQKNIELVKLEEEERQLLRQLEYFEGIVEKAGNEFKPNELSNYLLILAKQFNLFYEKYPILDHEKQDFRLNLSEKVGETIKVGLYLLGIETVERM